MACPTEAFEKTDKAAGCQEGKASTKAAAMVQPGEHRRAAKESRRQGRGGRKYQNLGVNWTQKVKWREKERRMSNGESGVFM